LRARFPDSEICGSTGARPSSQLIAACYVLHRLCAPRHPPNALAVRLIAQHSFHAQKQAQAGSGSKSAPCTDHFRDGMYAIRLSVFRINRSCKPANPAFTMSEILETSGHNGRKFKTCVSVETANSSAKAGGADRDRTDDLKLAKLALSQLSYGPGFETVLWVVGPGRVERPTSRLSGVRSNHLSYEPLKEHDIGGSALTQSTGQTGIRS
jgi:hypothetical protein